MQLHKKLNQKDKHKIRSTKEWQRLKDRLRDEHKVDFLSHKPLEENFNCHHIDLNPKNYADLSFEKFLPLNRNSHEVVHWIFDRYREDPNVLDRLKEVIELMMLYWNQYKEQLSIDDSKNQQKKSSFGKSKAKNT